MRQFVKNMLAGWKKAKKGWASAWPHRPVRPQVEFLEDRVIPTVAGWLTPGQSGWLTPAQVRQHYGFDNIWFPINGGPSIQGDGRGQTIAILAMAQQPGLYSIDTLLQDNIVNDLRTFNTQFVWSRWTGKTAILR
jgi:hypothetical protein